MCQRSRAQFQDVWKIKKISFGTSFFSAFDQSSSADDSMSKSDSFEDRSVFGFQFGGSKIDLWRKKSGSITKKTFWQERRQKTMLWLKYQLPILPFTLTCHVLSFFIFILVKSTTLTLVVLDLALWAAWYQIEIISYACSQVAHVAKTLSQCK